MQKIRIDFDNPGLPQHISAVENDSQSRFFQATLYENGKAYTAPAGASYSIMYRGFGPQNQGWYDTINDGAGNRAACAVSGNVVTCEIARQALQVPGHVSIVLCVTTGKGYMLKSWPIECDCKNDRYDSTAEIQSFFYITQVSNEDWNRAIQAVEELKNTIDPTLSLSGKAADAKATGDAVGELKEDLSAPSKNIFAWADKKIGYALSPAGEEMISPENGYTESYIYLGANRTYTLSCAERFSALRILYYKDTKALSGSSIIEYVPYSFTTTKNSTYCRLNFKKELENRLQLEEGSETSYAPAETANDTWLRKQYDLDKTKRNERSVIYIAASDSSEADKFMCKYVCDGTNDVDTLVAAINEIVSSGGGKIILKRGRYYINKMYARNRCVECNTGKTVVEIESELTNYNRSMSTGQDANTGAQLYMTDEFYNSWDASKPLAVLSIVGDNFDGGIVLKNIGIIIPDNQKPIIGLDMRRFNGMCRVEGMYINSYNATTHPEVSIGEAPPVAVDGSIGIRTICNTSLGTVGTQYKNCIVKGFYEGIAVNSEHVVLDRCASIYCVYGYTFDRYGEGAAGQHENLLLRCMDERNVNLPKFYNNTHGQATIILGLNIERKPSNTPGGEVKDFATEETPGTHYGEITYTIGDPYGTTNVDNVQFWADGNGHAMRSTNLHHLQACDTTTRKKYKPNYMQRIYDTTLNKEVICIDESIPKWVDAMGIEVD